MILLNERSIVGVLLFVIKFLKNYVCDAVMNISRTIQTVTLSPLTKKGLQEQEKNFLNTFM